jgi:hypothetical protein
MIHFCQPEVSVLSGLLDCPKWASSRTVSYHSVLLLISERVQKDSQCGGVSATIGSVTNDQNAGQEWVLGQVNYGGPKSWNFGS